MPSLEFVFLTLQPYIKAIHIVFIVSWFAGLFYNIRLFIYWTEAQDKEEPEKSILSRQFQIMSSRLWRIITIPSAYITLFCGLFLSAAWIYPHPHISFWFAIKLFFVLGLYIYHLYFYTMHKQMSNGIFRWTSLSLRYWNEVATLFLFAIVFLVILKDSLSMVKGLIILTVISLFIIFFIKKYREYKKKR